MDSIAASHRLLTPIPGICTSTSLQNCLQQSNDRASPTVAWEAALRVTQFGFLAVAARNTSFWVQAVCSFVFRH